ncbi:MAG: DnaD domain-containing protein [Chloroflexota bacterium]
MKSFVGFPAGKVRFTPIPSLFYTDLLPKIDDLAELKLTLFMFWFLHRQKGYPRYLTLKELKAEGLLLSALRCVDEEAEQNQEILEKALERAVRRGTILQLDISDQEGAAHYFFLNTAQGRKAVEEVKRGELLLEKTGYVEEPQIERPRPNIFELYEQNIGLLTPLLAEKLEEAERDYPQDWIEEAFQIAVERNVRNWRYVEAILERWKREGKT